MIYLYLYIIYILFRKSDMSLCVLHIMAPFLGVDEGVRLFLHRLAKINTSNHSCLLLLSIITECFFFFFLVWFLCL